MTVRPSARFDRIRVGRETCPNLPVQNATELAVLAVPLEGAAAAPLEEAVPVLRLAELVVALGQEVHFRALARRRRIFTVWRQSKLAIHGLPTQITIHFSLSRSFVLPHFTRF